LFASLAALAACGGNPVAENAEAAATLPAPQTVNVSDPSGAAPPANAAPGATPGRLGGEIAPIPAALQGRWSLAPEDCTAGSRGRGLLTVGGTELRFYESVARPTGNVEPATDSYSADFAFTGEGMNWSKFQTLQLQGGRLIRTESSPMTSFTYVRCS
jgi:hypothetical protein